MTSQQKFSWAALIIGVGFVAAVIYHYVLGFHAGLGYPRNTFLFQPKDAFMDFKHFMEANADNNPYLGLGSGHFPFCNLVARLFTFLKPSMAKAGYIAVVLGAAFVLCFRRGQSGDKAGDFLKTGVLAICTYPMLFTLDRGNFEGFVFAFLVAFIISYKRKAFLWSAAFLAMAIAMKGFPVFLLVLFAADRRYKEAGMALVLTVLFTVVSFMSFQGGFYDNLDFFMHGRGFEVKAFTGWFGNNSHVQRGVSLFTALKIMMVRTGLIQHVDMTAFLKIYKVVTMLLFIPLAVYVVVVERVLWKRIALLVFAMLLLPHLSGDYKLLHLLLPVMLFIGESREERLDPVYLGLFVLLLIPKGYHMLWYISSDGGIDISSAVLLNPLLMLLIGTLIIVSGLRAPRDTSLRQLVREHFDAGLSVFSRKRL